MAELVSCPTCNKQLSSEAPSCPHCGHPFAAAPAPPVAAPPQPPAPAAPPKKRFSWGRVGCMLAVVVVAYVAWSWFPREGKDAVSRIVQGGEKVVVDEEFGVPSKSWQGRGFALSRSANVEVDIACDGDGVNVYVVDQSDYEQFKDAHQSLFGGNYKHYPHFHMLRATRNRTDGRMGPGSYWVIVENPTWGVIAKANFNVRLKVTARP